MDQEERLLLWTRLAQEISDRTGVRVARQFHTKEKRVAEHVLPLLADRVPQLDDPDLRHHIYGHFQTPHAYPYFAKIVQWWEQEQYGPGISCLTQILTSLLKKQDAKKMWMLWKSRPPLGDGLDYLLLEKLASFQDVGPAVRDFIVQELHKSQLGVAELQHVYRIDDGRIRDWFKSQLNSSNKDIRSFALRAVQREPRLPQGVKYQSSEPNPDRKLFSAEVDLDQLDSTLRELSTEIGFSIPKSLRLLSFLSNLETNRWVTTEAVSMHGSPITISLRMEDIDTVEVVLTT